MARTSRSELVREKAASGRDRLLPGVVAAQQVRDLLEARSSKQARGDQRSVAACAVGDDRRCRIEAAERIGEGRQRDLLRAGDYPVLGLPRVAHVDQLQ